LKTPANNFIKAVQVEKFDQMASTGSRLCAKVLPIFPADVRCGTITTSPCRPAVRRWLRFISSTINARRRFRSQVHESTAPLTENAPGENSKTTVITERDESPGEKPRLTLNLGAANLDVARRDVGYG